MTTSPAASAGPSWQRRLQSLEAAAIAGLAFAALSVVSLFLFTGQPSPTAPESEISAWYADATNRRSVIAALILATLSGIAFMWFIAVIRRVGDREDRFFATVFLGSGILLTAIMLVGATALASVAVGVEFLGGLPPDGSGLTLIGGLAYGLLLLVLPRAQAVFILSTATLSLRTDAVPRWLSIFGYVIGLPLFVLPLLVGPVVYIFPIWVGVMSGTLLVRRAEIDGATSPFRARGCSALTAQLLVPIAAGDSLPLPGLLFERGQSNFNYES